ncbi:MAG: hypothetical protein ACRDQW_13240, partial [Haloechinothrix sp.]
VLDWLTRYPLWVVVVLAAAGLAIYVGRVIAEQVAEKKTELAFTARQLRIEGRSSFENRVLTDRYEIFNQIFARLVRITTDLNRVQAGGAPHTEPFLMRAGSRTEVVPLTEIFDELEQHRLLLGDEIYYELAETADLILRMANAGSDESGVLATRWSQARGRLRDLAETQFGLSQIRWHRP